MIFLLLKTKVKTSYKTSYTKIINKSISKKELDSLLKGYESEKWNSFTAIINNSLMLNKPITFIDQTCKFVLDKIENKQNFTLRDNEVAQGIVGAPDKAFVITENGLSTFNEDELNFLKQFHTSVKRYFTEKNNKYIFYLTKKNINSLHYTPNIKERLTEYTSQLKNRREVKSGQIKYFHLQWPRNETFFKEGGKIICATRTFIPACTYTDKSFYGSRALNFIKTNRINLKYLTSILNSKIAHFWLKHKGKLTGDLLQIDKSQLLSIPIFMCVTTIPFEILVDCILFAKENDLETEAQTYESVIDGLVFQLYFLDHMKEKQIDILQFVEKDLAEVMQDRDFKQLSDSEKQNIINQLHSRWSHPDSEVRNRIKLFAVRSPEILKPILESR